LQDITTPPTIHEDGIYFSMPDTEYHADESLGSTNLKQLLVSPSNYWWMSSMNPVRPPDKETPARLRGSAYHALILMGEAYFEQHYQRKVDKASIEGLLDTADDLKRVLTEYGLPVKGRKAELIELVKEKIPKLYPKVWDVIDAEQDASGKKLLPGEVYDDVKVATTLITKNPALAGAFTGGMPEVSIFWTDNGVRLKARIDYLKIRTCGDLKSFTNTLDQPLPRAIRKAVAQHRYDIQANHYMNGRAKLKEFVENGQISGDVDMDWLKKVAAYEDYGFTWVFYEVGGPPNAIGLQYERGHEYDMIAGAEVNNAIQRWKESMEKFGTESAWIDMSPVEVLLDGDMPSWVGR
jgi:hypothetical protein